MRYFFFTSLYLEVESAEQLFDQPLLLSHSTVEGAHYNKHTVHVTVGRIVQAVLLHLLIHVFSLECRTFA